MTNAPKSASEEWLLNLWAPLINWLQGAADQIAVGQDEISELLSDEGRRGRFSQAIKGGRWANWYSWPTLVTMTAAGAVIFPLYTLQEGLDRIGLGKKMASIGISNISNSKGERDFILAPRMGVAAWKTMDAQVRAILAFQQPMNALLRAGAAGNDERYFDALRIDSSVVAFGPFVTRLHTAVASQDKKFLSRMNSALRNPVDLAELDFPRLRAALWLMHRAKNINLLTPSSAYELFVVRTKLYPALGMEDSKRSLWKFVQRLKKELATKSRE